MYSLYEINLWLNDLVGKLALLNPLFGALNFTKYANPNKYFYSGYGIGFDVCGTFSLVDGSESRKNVVIFGVDISSFLYADNGKKDISILSKAPTDGLDDNSRR